MRKPDTLYHLEGSIEFDEGYFERATSEKVVLKRGRGSQRQLNVAVMEESIPLENIATEAQSKQCRYFKMKVFKTHQSMEIKELSKENFQNVDIVFSDKSTSYIDISDYVETHVTEKSNKHTTKTTLK